MKKLLWAVLCGAFVLASGADAGKPQPRLQTAKWYFRTATAAGPLECTVLFDVTGENAREILHMLESLQEEYQIPIQAVAINAITQTDSFAAATGPYRIGLAADDRLKTRNTLAENESLFPYAVLSKDGVVVWSGHPTELDSVIGQVKADKISLSRQKRVESLRKQLQMAIQSGLPHVVASTADKILKESPSDRIAIQAKIMALASGGRNAEIPEFVRKLCADDPQDLQLRLMQMDLLLRDGDNAGFLRAVEQFSRDFTKPEPKLVRPVAFIVENTPYGLLMPELVMGLAQRALEAVKADPQSLLHAIACETLARVRAEQGDFAEAVKLQEQALPMRLKTPQEAAAKQRLEYYRALLKNRRPDRKE